MLLARRVLVSLVLCTVTALHGKDPRNSPLTSAFNQAAAAFLHLSVAVYALTIGDMVVTAGKLRAELSFAKLKDQRCFLSDASLDHPLELPRLSRRSRMATTYLRWFCSICRSSPRRLLV
ncbi:hypothetical protein BKA62DRAFT_350558 [Auriculariales sp. MPI-PUGE-AT-0066]|nr:hypothetical protein BKA62DRAFT_350558 [Auriculariales sp. MPI-PUGE-AT-0066]